MAQAESNFNQLTPAELERLALLGEEMAEAQQVIGKILRHGYESYNPTILDSRTNRGELAHELGHVLNALDMLVSACDVQRFTVETSRQKKSESVKKYLHHQEGES